MVRAVDQGDVDVSVLQALDGKQAAETGADDDDVVTAALRAKRGFRHEDVFSFKQ